MQNQLNKTEVFPIITHGWCCGWKILNKIVSLKDTSNNKTVIVQKKYSYVALCFLRWDKLNSKKLVKIHLQDVGSTNV